jgi:hypothetical protein
MPKAVSVLWPSRLQATRIPRSDYKQFEICAPSRSPRGPNSLASNAVEIPKIRSPRFGTHFSVLGVDSGRFGRRPIYPSIIQHDRVPLHLDLVSRSRSNVIVISSSIQVNTSSSACHSLSSLPHTEPPQSFPQCL